MYCPSCGLVLTQQTRYCNRCGAQLGNAKNVELIKLYEQRMDSEMEGLFWITCMGIGLILGGIALMKKVVHVDDWIVLAYLTLASLAFTAYFGMGVWQIRRLARSLKEAHGTSELTSEGMPELGPANLDSIPSVTEHTTRTLERVSIPTDADRALPLSQRDSLSGSG